MNGQAHQGILLSETYFVIKVSDSSYRIVDHNGEPILYPKELFHVVDRHIPQGWQFSEYEDGDYTLEPAVVRPGFYEDFFNSNGDRVAQATAERQLNEFLRSALESGSDEDKRLIERDLARLASRIRPPPAPSSTGPAG
jgi:hypothetical protein